MAPEPPLDYEVIIIEVLGYLIIHAVLDARFLLLVIGDVLDLLVCPHAIVSGTLGLQGKGLFFSDLSAPWRINPYL